MISEYMYIVNTSKKYQMISEYMYIVNTSKKTVIDCFVSNDKSVHCQHWQENCHRLLNEYVINISKKTVILFHLKRINEFIVSTSNGL